MKEQIDSEIGFDDGELQGYSRDDSTVTVHVRAWNEASIYVRLSDAVGLTDYGLGDISAFVVESVSTELLKKVLSYIYESPPEQHSYKSYQFLDLDDGIRLEIIAQSADLTYRNVEHT